MKQQIKVLANYINNLTDARYFAAFEVDWLVYCLDQSTEGFLEGQEVKEIMEWIDGPKACGYFGNVKDEDWTNFMVKDLPLSTILVDRVIDTDAEIILKVKGSQKEEVEKVLEANSEKVGSFLLVDSAGIPQKTLTELCKKYPIILSSEHKVDELEDLIIASGPAGVELRGGTEEKVGFKSFDELDALFNIIKSETEDA